MFFRTSSRIHSQTGRLSIYYRLVENSRDPLGGISRRTIMTVGYMEDVSTEELHSIAGELFGLHDRIILYDLTPVLKERCVKATLLTANTA